MLGTCSFVAVVKTILTTIDPGGNLTLRSA
jgi:hypothetical protein